MTQKINRKNMDTVVYRLHNASEYPIIRQVLLQDKTSGRETFNTLSEKLPKKLNRRRFLMDYTRDEAIPIRWTDELHIPSSNHNIPITYDHDRDFLEMNLSLPKYYFGNNVIELLIPPHHKRFSVNAVSPYDQIGFWLSCIKKVFYKCLLQFTGGIPVDINWHDVEVYRIDIAVNQVFQTKEEALRYLEHQRTIRKKFERDSGKKAGQWETTMAFQSQRYYVKVYHKGSEFENIQSKKIASILAEKEKEQGKKIFKKTDLNNALNIYKAVEENTNLKESHKHRETLQSFSDRCLRYEFTFRPVMLSYIFNRKLNKLFSKHYAQFKKIYDFLKRDFANDRFLKEHRKKYLDTNNVLHVSIPPNWVRILYFKRDENGVESEFTEKEYQIIYLLHKYSIKDARDIKAWLKFMSMELTGARSFRLALPPLIIDTTKKDVLLSDVKVGEVTPLTKTPKEVLFSKKLMYLLTQEVHNFFNNFQIDTKDTTQELLDKIAAHNIRVQDQIKVTISLAEQQRLKKTLIGSQLSRSLVQFHTLHTGSISKRKLMGHHFSRATYHRLKKRYTEITGKNFQIAHIHWGYVNKDFPAIYKEVYQEILSGCFAKFYNNAFRRELSLI